MSKPDAIAWRYCLKKVFIKRFSMFTEKRLCWSSFFNKVAGWRSAALSKKIPAQVSSGGFCGFCKIYKNKYFEEHLQMPA